MAKQDVTDRLRDPTTATFSGVVWNDDGVSAVVCGKVNARNGFGGMAGDQRFIRLFSKEERSYAHDIVGEDKELRELTRRTMVGARELRSSVQWSSDPKAAASDQGPDPVLVFEGEVPADQMEAVWTSRCVLGRPAL